MRQSRSSHSSRQDASLSAPTSWRNLIASRAMIAARSGGTERIYELMETFIDFCGNGEKINPEIIEIPHIFFSFFHRFIFFIHFENERVQYTKKIYLWKSKLNKVIISKLWYIREFLKFLLSCINCLKVFDLGFWFLINNLDFFSVCTGEVVGEWASEVGA